MSKYYETSSCGFAFRVPGPATVEDYDAAAGKPGSALEDAVASEIWRGTLPKWQREFTPKLEALTGIKREVDAAKTEAAKKSAKNPENVSDVLEKFSSFAKRARGSFLAGLEGDALAAAEAQLNALAQEVAETTPVDPSPTSREAAASKASLAKADSILLLEDDEIETKVQKIMDVVPSVSIDRDENTGKPTRTSLARAIDAWMVASL